MHAVPWLRNLLRRSTPIREMHRSRLRLERLEDRTVPTTWIVTTLADSGMGSLRNGIGLAADGDTIAFDPSLNGNAIDLTTGELLVQHDISIVGPGSDQLTVERSSADGTPAFRIFEIAARHSVSISGLTISNGLVNTDDNGLPVVSTALGGGIYNAFEANLTVTNSLLYGNGAGSCNQTGMANSRTYGGAVYNDGTASFTSTTFDHNSAVGSWASFSEGGGGIVVDVQEAMLDEARQGLPVRPDLVRSCTGIFVSSV